ncbi:MAG TPA: hypothetical protein VEV16_07330 [Daejeonella sp.]|nr:hypothetical protein [Daejeonella sp.]
MRALIKISVIVILIMAIGSSCEKDIVATEIKPCNLSNSIKSASNLHGVVGLNSSVNSYAIHVSIQGTYDSQDVGFVCNLPEKYRVDGLKIVFSGKYFKYENKDLQQIPGQSYYILELDEIQVEANN